MHASFFFTAFLAAVMAQQSSVDNSPITTITLDASAIIPPATTSSSVAVPTITNTRPAVTTITISSNISPAVTSPVGSVSQKTVLLTSTITSTLCGACTTPTGAVTVAPVATTIRSSSIVYSSRNATASGVPYGGSDVFPVNKGTTLSNGTIVYSAAGNLPGAGSLAITAGLLAASYFALVL